VNEHGEETEEAHREGAHGRVLDKRTCDNEHQALDHEHGVPLAGAYPVRFHVYVPEPKHQALVLRCPLRPLNDIHQAEWVTKQEGHNCAHQHLLPRCEADHLSGRLQNMACSGILT